MDESTRGTGLMIKGTEQVMRGTQMETSTKANLNEERLTEKEFITGTQERCMTENGRAGLKRAMVYGKE